MNLSDIPAYMAHVGATARAAATTMAAAGHGRQGPALLALARGLRRQAAALQAANAQDLAAARAAGLAEPLVDRLKLTPQVIETVAQGCEQIAAMPDPVGEITGVKRRPSGISVGQMRVPLGVFGMIYESRPNVTIEAASLAIKSGNACILRGGSEALHSQPGAVAPGAGRAGRSRPAARCRATGADHRPRRRGPPGGHARVRGRDHPARRQGPDRAHQRRSARARHQAPGRQLPRLCGRRGRPGLALRVTDNAKTQKYSPCNAAESLLVHAAQAAAFLPRIGALFAAKGVEMRCEPAPRRCWPACPGGGGHRRLGEEYLAPIISIKVVDSLDEAMAHINRYGSHHTDAILTTTTPTPCASCAKWIRPA
jgi:glutamate-5-semialdehyde dehydrogenase